MRTHPKRCRPTDRPTDQTKERRQAGRQTGRNGNGKRSEPPDSSCPRWRANVAEECSRNEQPASAGRAAIPRLTTTAAAAATATRRLDCDAMQRRRPVAYAAAALNLLSPPVVLEIASPFGDLSKVQSDRHGKRTKRKKAL